MPKSKGTGPEKYALGGKLMKAGKQTTFMTDFISDFVNGELECYLLFWITL